VNKEMNKEMNKRANKKLKLVKTLPVLMLSLLMGCAAEVVPTTSYYLLNNSQSTPPAKVQKDKVVILKVLELPEYLNQAQMVMQMADHQLHYAHFHMWAEPLKDGLIKALVADLNAAERTVQFLPDRRKNRLDDNNQLYVQIDFFHTSSESKVTLAGHYWYEGKGIETAAPQPFHIEQHLQQDGYPHSVSQMRALVGRLAGEIASAED
jgi:uncharacterized lipoprotein YmbA